MARISTVLTRPSTSTLWRDVLLPVFGGVVLASFVTIVLYWYKPVWIVLIIAGLLVLIPSFLVKDVRLYWLGIFLFVIEFDLKKNLVDGLTVLDSLKIDYMQFVFTPEIRLSDLPLLILLAVWGHKLLFQGVPMMNSKEKVFALGFLGWAVLSAVKAPHLYLSVIEILRQCKFFLIYLYAANNVASKRIVKIIWLVLASSLLVQVAVTAGRFHFDYFEPLQDLLGVKEPGSEYGLGGLQIDSPTEPSTIGPSVRSFGSLSSPGSTAKYCVLVLPIALMLCLRNPLFQRRWFFALLVLAGTVTLYFTFSRSFLVAYLVEIVLCFWYGLRRGYIRQHVAVYLLCLSVTLGAVSAPFIYKFMNNRESAVEVRLRQYEVALDMIKSNPVLGVGINNSTGVKRQFTADSSFVQDPIRQSGTQPIHSFYLTLIAETGVIGFLLYAAFFGAIFRQALRLSRSAQDKEVAFSATILLICFSGMAVGVLTDPLYEDSLQTLLWLYAGMVAALKGMDNSDGFSKASPPRSLPSDQASVGRESRFSDGLRAPSTSS